MATSFGLSYRILDLHTKLPLFKESISHSLVERLLVRVAQKLAEQSLVTPQTELAIECDSFSKGKKHIKESRLNNFGPLLTLAADHYRPVAMKEAKDALTSNIVKVIFDEGRLKRLREDISTGAVILPKPFQPPAPATLPTPAPTSSKDLTLPTLQVGDLLMVGKFKNRKAVIQGFDTDAQGQPLAKTDKGVVQIFKGRIVRLMSQEEQTRLGQAPPK